MNHLLRSHAPITEEGWKLIDEEARLRLGSLLAARKLVDFEAPVGWTESSTDLGRVKALAQSPVDGVKARLRRVLPFVELRKGFTVSREEIDDAARGATDLDLSSLDEAARHIALAENVAVFHGFDDGEVSGIVPSTPHPVIALDRDLLGYPTHVAKAVEVLLKAGVGGPYGLAVGPDIYTSVVETTEHGGYLLFEHLRQILGGPLVWAPGVKGAVVVSLRGGDFTFRSGQDLSIGYTSHDDDVVHLYLEESFTFQIISTDAAVALGGSR